MKGCGALLGCGLALAALYGVWLWVSATADPVTVASTGRCLVLAVGGLFLLTAAIIVVEPKEG